MLLFLLLTLYAFWLLPYCWCTGQDVAMKAVTGLANHGIYAYAVQGKTALQYAAAAKAVDIAETLIFNDADLNVADLQVRLPVA